MRILDSKPHPEEERSDVSKDEGLFAKQQREAV
jgi:hypothetical protein